MSTQKFSKPLFHVQKHTGGAVKLDMLMLQTLIGSVEKRDGLSSQTWMFYPWKNAEKSLPFTVAQKW